MIKIAVLVSALLVSGCQSTVQQGPSFASAFPSKEWSKSGAGSGAKFLCKIDSCGGEKTEISYSSISSFGLAPDLGITGGKNLEEEFRTRQSVRTTLVAMLKRLLRSEDPGANINLVYFSNANYVGYKVSGYSPKWGTHVLGEVRFDNDTIILIGTESEDLSRLRPLLSKLSSNLVIKIQR
jgi:hypothetical protein